MCICIISLIKKTMESTKVSTILVLFLPVRVLWIIPREKVSSITNIKQYSLGIQRHQNELTSMWGLCCDWDLEWTVRAIDQESTNAWTEEDDNFETQQTDKDVHICIDQMQLKIRSPKVFHVVCHFTYRLLCFW